MPRDKEKGDCSRPVGLTPVYPAARTSLSRRTSSRNPFCVGSRTATPCGGPGRRKVISAQSNARVSHLYGVSTYAGFPGTGNVHHRNRSYFYQQYCFHRLQRIWQPPAVPDSGSPVLITLHLLLSGGIDIIHELTVKLAVLKRLIPGICFKEWVRQRKEKRFK